MKQEIKEEIKNLDNMELMKAIYKEIIETKEAIKNIDKKIDNLDKIEKLHFEYITNKFNRIEQKIDSNFKYLEEKIDNTKNKLVSETTDIFESFSVATTKSIKNLENKMDNEKNERIMEISKMRSLNDYDRIILKNLESRITILEEESQNYEVN